MQGCQAAFRPAGQGGSDWREVLSFQISLICERSCIAGCSRRHWTLQIVAVCTNYHFKSNLRGMHGMAEKSWTAAKTCAKSACAACVVCRARLASPRGPQLRCKLGVAWVQSGVQHRARLQPKSASSFCLPETFDFAHGPVELLSEEDVLWHEGRCVTGFGRWCLRV